MAKYWHSGTVEVQDTSRHYGLRCSKHRWPNASLVVDTVGEAVTTGLYICEFLMKDESYDLICSLLSSLFTTILS